MRAVVIIVGLGLAVGLGVWVWRRYGAFRDVINDVVDDAIRQDVERHLADE